MDMDNGLISNQLSNFILGLKLILNQTLISPEIFNRFLVLINSLEIYNPIFK